MALIYDLKRRKRSERHTPDEPHSDPADPKYWEWEPPGQYQFREMKVPAMLILALCCLALSLGLVVLAVLQLWLTGSLSHELMYAAIGAFMICAVLAILHRFIDPSDAI